MTCDTAVKEGQDGCQEHLDCGEHGDSVLSIQVAGVHDPATATKRFHGGEVLRVGGHEGSVTANVESVRAIERRACGSDFRPRRCQRAGLPLCPAQTRRNIGEIAMSRWGRKAPRT
jgi:hypothetical protein